MKANYRGGQKLNSNAMLKKAQKVQKQLEEALEELSNKEYAASSGGGMVKVVATGDMKLKSVCINREFFLGEEKKESETEKSNLDSTIVGSKDSENSIDSSDMTANKSDIDIDMLEDLIIAAVNEAISSAKIEKEETIEKLSNFNLNGILSSL